MEPIRIQRVVDHIEGHLTGELSGEELAAMMAVSEADLQRSFKMITGWTMGEYIRCRRLSEAALDLKRGGRVLDAALTYGYQTAESFSKAFKQYHGCTPAEARRADRPIRYFSPMVIKLAKRGGSVTERKDGQPERVGSVAAYYDANDESGRLTGSRHGRMEYLITMEYLREVLLPHGRVLDCCAGTGVYAFELAKDHRVVAGDLSEKNVDRMERLQESCPVLEEIHRLDACDLSRFGDGSFDGVLCMGALYHLPDRERRMRAIRECARVCREGGVLVFAYLNKWGSFYNGLINNLKPMDLLYREFESGVHEDIFFRTTPEEVDSMCREAGLTCRYNIGVDHLAFLAAERIDAMDEREYGCLLEQQRKAAREPGLAGASLHGLWIGGKGQWGSN